LTALDPSEDPWALAGASIRTLINPANVTEAILEYFISLTLRRLACSQNAPCVIGGNYIKKWVTALARPTAQALDFQI
jgi:hypothetical protein